jgi:hypothetical protein
MQNNPLSRRSFLAFQALLIPALIAIPLWRGSELDRSERQIEFLDQPTNVLPLHDYQLVITDEQLHAVLSKLQPKFRHQNPKINHVDHALRFWGVEATFAEVDSVSGVEMRQILTDHSAFNTVWGKEAQPLLISKADGIKVRMQQGAATASHVDHTLATLAECGTPLSFPIQTSSGQSTLRALLDRSVATFHLNQTEYEWSVLSFALYARDGRPWFTSEGDQIDFNRMAKRIMRQRLEQGVCFGNHRLFTLAMLLRIDQQKPILSSDARNAILEHLSDATRRLIATQSNEGYWDRNWPDPNLPAEHKSITDPLARQLLATGHALEWWAMAPEELHPPREVLIRAGQWLVREVDKLDEKRLPETYTFLTHVGRALSLWRAEMPAAAWQRLERQRRAATNNNQPVSQES